MSLLRIDTSVTGPQSASRELADIVQAQWLEQHPDAGVVTRDLASNPIPATYWTAALAAGQTPVEERTPEQHAATALATELYDELRAAETIVFASGLYNWGLSQYIKAWVDLVVIAAPQGEPFLQGKDVALVVTRGGYYGPGAPKEGWDHQTPWVHRMLSEVWGANVTLVEREFTLVGVNPALDDFKEQAAVLATDARERSHAVGKELAAAYASRK